MEKQKNIPVLRFPEFLGEWEKKKLGEVADKITDGTHDTPKPTIVGIPFLTAIHIKDGFIDYDNCYYLNQEVHNLIYKRCNPEKGDLLMVNIGAGTATCATNSVEYEFSLKNVALVKPNKQILNSNYLGQYQRIKSAKIFNQLASGGAQPFLSLNQIGKLTITFPALPEQTKIATFLTAVDKKLTALKQKKTLLEHYKKGVMQQLFSQELRFKDDNGNDFADWEEKKLGEVGTFYSGGTPLTTKRQYFGGKIPFIRSGEINSNYTEQFITEDGLKNSSAKMVEVGDILYALYGATSGEVGISKINGAINQAVLCIKSNENHFFIYSFLIFEKENITKTFLQGGQGNLSADIVKKLSIPIPCLEEQTKIATFLSAIDDKINHCQGQIAKMEVWKKGLLQQMFV